MKNRRGFIKAAGQSVIAGSLLGTSACSLERKEDTINVNFNKSYHWKMTTTWPPNFPVLGEGCILFAKWVKEMSGGRMQVTVYGGGELIPALEGFDAVSNGAVEMNHGAAYYWAGKLTAAPFFTTVPFGMNAQQMEAWLIAGNGAGLWEELYEPYGILPMICGNTGVQMGGWFNREIRDLSDIKGLKMRMPGLGGKVLAAAGGTPMLMPGAEIYTNLERGVIDATEWIGPYHDYKMGFHQIAQYYYYPGWHEPGPVLELLINKQKFMALPVDLQMIIKAAAHRVNRWMMASFDSKNGEYLGKIRTESDVHVLPFPKTVLHGLKEATQDVLSSLVNADPFVSRVFQDYQKFRKQLMPWADISERIYYEQLS